MIDPRTLAPLDIGTILASVHKTGRLLVVDEDFGPCGVGAEIAAQVMERGFDDLDAPVGASTAPTPPSRTARRSRSPWCRTPRPWSGRSAISSPSRPFSGVARGAPGRPTGVTRLGGLAVLFAVLVWGGVADSQPAGKVARIGTLRLNPMQPEGRPDSAPGELRQGLAGLGWVEGPLPQSLLLRADRVIQ